MNVVLGVGGGIAAYKAAELARELMERGCNVQVVMTAAAQEFIRPLTFAALTGRKVISDLFSGAGAEETLSSAIEHIRVAQENDVLVMAPATADLIASIAHGLAGDFLTTTYLAFTGPVVIAPAMNVNMWNHPATRENVRTLAARGHAIVEPEEGALACGMVGPGRLAEPRRIADAVMSTAATPAARRDLEGETVLITAGPTQEPLDAVRYISNRSSGKMGFALANAALGRGARVVLVSGPVHLAAPRGAETIHVKTAAEMRRAVMDRLEDATMIVKTAAVADYYRTDAPKQKVKKTAARLSLELDPTPDILAEVGRNKGDRLLVGFAAETENLVEEARRKLKSKNCDMVVANLVSQEGAGFESDENEVVLVLRTGEAIPVRRAAKTEIAQRILDEMIKLRLALHMSA
ncbi:MAG TPA: bifunctional phosphopantothenoylcysteine decarboxylase/phosphopantothenate--cysteine ligase CoaBC [Bryobacteraceae bacterium]|jgi:phosphopantothenoylcysteine decarboxylase/phosphopantothenate--cysteine ligase